MNKFPDDVFQIFLEYNDQPEIMGLLTWIDEDNDYRVKKYIYYISNELKRREWDKEMEKRKKNKGQINNWTYKSDQDDFEKSNKVIGNLTGGIGLDKFFNQNLTGN